MAQRRGSRSSSEGEKSGPRSIGGGRPEGTTMPTVYTPAPRRTHSARGGGAAREEGGGTIAPIYGERRPMMYHLFETEVRSISSLNGEALRYFSIGAFLLATDISIVIADIFAPDLPKIPEPVVHWGVGIIGVLSVLCYGLGGLAVYTKKTVIKQIKAETIVKSEPSTD